MIDPLDSERTTDPELGPVLGPQKAEFFARLFRHTRMSYKFFWFLGLLELVHKKRTLSIPLSQVLHEMAVLAWHPVCFYRLSLGVGDALQKKLRGFHSASNLNSDAGRSAILAFLSHEQWATDELRQCVEYVPTRLLQAHFQKQLEGLPDQRKDSLTRELAVTSQKRGSPSMYWFRSTPESEFVEMNENWALFLTSHYGVLRSFAEYHLCRYLQSKNPNVPGIVNKLHATTQRKLEAAHKYWAAARTAFDRSTRSDWFIDIYTLRQLTGSFDIDHFLPWSFVAHDLLWNLTPVDCSTNSAKRDRLPRLKEHLPRLAVLHHRALQMLCLFNKRVADERLTHYEECFNLDAGTVLKLSEAEFIAKYWQVMEPQERIARSQGFGVLR
jgi:HNH endonuclease